MAAIVTRPTFDRERRIAVIPGRLADTPTRHIVYGSLAVAAFFTLFGLRGTPIALLMGAGILVACLAFTYLTREYARRNPWLAIDSVGIVFPSWRHTFYVKWSDVSRITQQFSGFSGAPGSFGRVSGIRLTIHHEQGSSTWFLLPVMNWRDRDRLFHILSLLSREHGFELSITDPDTWHGDER
ncbi:hypothetical protein ACKTEK_03515 [Tepidamorphus sp. 3E244]|uniref:hypothetical protein n=1 Tax=Tepidamorphus sp. 3E244 TaxID=3385498 RepID=UPI0038FCFF28